MNRVGCYQSIVKHKPYIPAIHVKKFCLFREEVAHLVMIPIQHVFLIDDDVASNMINTEIIKAYNKQINVKSFVNPINALEDIQKVVLNSAPKPQIIFIDINMPVSNGWAIVESLENINELMDSRCKVYILSGSNNSLDIDKSNNYKIVKGFISKPLTVAHLQLLFES